MCHSENRYGDKQNKNRRSSQTEYREYIWAINRIETVGALLNCWQQMENRYGDKQNKNR